MACYIFGAGEITALHRWPQPGDYVIAADGGWSTCCAVGLAPDLLLGDFDSLADLPSDVAVERHPVEKDDTDMMLAIKRGLALGYEEFHLYGGMGGRRTDHTVANLQALLYLANRGAQGWLYGQGEVYTAVCNTTAVFSPRERGILSVFCLGGTARGVTIHGAQYEVTDAMLTADFPLGVSNHFAGKEVKISVCDGSLLIGLLDE